MSYKSTLSYSTSSKDPKGTTTLEAHLYLSDEISPIKLREVKERLGYYNRDKFDEYFEDLKYINLHPNCASDERYYSGDLESDPARKVSIKINFGFMGIPQTTLHLRASCPGHMDELELFDLLKFKHYLLFGKE